MDNESVIFLLMCSEIADTFDGTSLCLECLLLTALLCLRFCVLFYLLSNVWGLHLED